MRAARPGSSWLSRLGYQRQLEERALEQLAAADFESCRRSFGLLFERLDLRGVSADWRQVVLLLVDLVQRVNGEVYRLTRQDQTYQATRWALIDSLAGCRDLEAARRHCLALLDDLLGSSAAPDPALPPLVRSAQAYVRQHYARRVSLSLIAAELNVSPGHLARSFREAAGQTLTAYVHRVRVDHALGLLAHGGHRISEVAYLVGYQTYRDFHRNFVKYQKAAPRTVRNRSAAARTYLA